MELASVTDMANLAINLLTGLMVLVGFFSVIPYARGKRASQAIVDLEHALNAAQARITAAEQMAQEAKDEAQKCHVESQEWKARYEEARRYTAREAVQHFEAMMADHSSKVATRHEKMLDHLEIQTEAVRNLAELLGHNTTIVKAIADRVGVGDIKPFIART